MVWLLFQAIYPTINSSRLSTFGTIGNKPKIPENNKISFQFVSEPTDVNFGGKVHGGIIMEWIDQTAYTCARNWAETYCVTVYVGGICFLKPISTGKVIKINAL